MCGLAGFIGEAKDPEFSHKLLTALMEKTEIRGDDASGYWGANKHNDDKATVYWSKEAAKSTIFVNRDAWKLLAKEPLDLLIAHCRKSTCRGSEDKNINNHPHISTDYCTALVHNGNVPEYNSLRGQYDVVSDCDSEILLRMVEHGSTYPKDFIRSILPDVKNDHGKKISECTDEEMPYWSHRLTGIIDIFSRIAYGAMAAAIGERWPDGTRALWLFRDKERPLHVVDLRQNLNQIFFCSEPRIWRDAVLATPNAKKYMEGTSIIEFKPNYVWLIRKTPQGEWLCRKFQIQRNRRNDTTFDKERPPVASMIAMPAQSVRIVTNLDRDNHEIIDPKKKQGANNQQPIAASEPLQATVLPDSQPTDNTNTLAADAIKSPSLSIPSTPTTHVTDSATQVTPATSDRPRTDNQIEATINTGANNVRLDGLYDGMFKWIVEHTKATSRTNETMLARPDLEQSAKDCKIHEWAMAGKLTLTACSRHFETWAKRLHDAHKWPSHRIVTGAAELACTAEILKVAYNNYARAILTSASHAQLVQMTRGRREAGSKGSTATVKSGAGSDDDGGCSHTTSNTPAVSYPKNPEIKLMTGPKRRNVSVVARCNNVESQLRGLSLTLQCAQEGGYLKDSTILSLHETLLGFSDKIKTLTDAVRIDRERNTQQAAQDKVIGDDLESLCDEFEKDLRHRETEPEPAYKQQSGGA